MRRDPLKELLTEVRDCKVCSPHLPLGANPILRAHSDARILLIGQAPGTRVHADLAAFASALVGAPDAAPGPA